MLPPQLKLNQAVRLLKRGDKSPDFSCLPYSAESLRVYLHKGGQAGSEVLHGAVGAHSPGSIHTLGQFLCQKISHKTALLAQQQLQWLFCIKIEWLSCIFLGTTDIASWLCMQTRWLCVSIIEALPLQDLPLHVGLRFLQGHRYAASELCLLGKLRVSIYPKIHLGTRFYWRKGYFMRSCVAACLHDSTLPILAAGLKVWRSRPKSLPMLEDPS